MKMPNMQAMMQSLGYSWDKSALSGKGAFILDGLAAPVYTGSTSFATSGRRGGGGGGGSSYGGYGSSSQMDYQWRIRIT